MKEMGLNFKFEFVLLGLFFRHVMKKFNVGFFHKQLKNSVLRTQFKLMPKET